MGADKCVVIDTGCGSGDVRAFIEKHVNVGPRRKPFLVVNTHIHFDHVGGNHRFPASASCLGICMGAKDKKFSQNIELMSLGAGVGSRVRVSLRLRLRLRPLRRRAFPHLSSCPTTPPPHPPPPPWQAFEVTRWLADGEELFLDDAHPSEFNVLRILWTPGHCIDHIAIVFPREQRIFVGDTMCA